MTLKAQPPALDRIHARLFEIRDCLDLALDVTESTTGYPQHMREARSYLRAALRHADKLIGGAQ